MANRLVKLITDDDGEEYNDPKWHLSVIQGSSSATLCTGEFFGYGESRCKYEVKTTEKGGITCQDCIDKIKEIKKVRL